MGVEPNPHVFFGVGPNFVTRTVAFGADRANKNDDDYRVTGVSSTAHSGSTPVRTLPHESDTVSCFVSFSVTIGSDIITTMGGRRPEKSRDRTFYQAPLVLFLAFFVGL